MNPHYPLVVERAAHQCEYCRAPEAVFNMAFEVEHIIPPLHGGLNEASNWALSCRSCNLHKSDCIEARESKRDARANEGADHLNRGDAQTRRSALRQMR